jgi:hypothetical protein
MNCQLKFLVSAYSIFFRSLEVRNARKHTRVSEYWSQKPLDTKNRFSSLSEDNNESKEEDQQNNTKDVLLSTKAATHDHLQNR